MHRVRPLFVSTYPPGVVDAADYPVWRKSFGQIGASLDADGNLNNQVDDGDYTVWRSHFGQQSGNGSGEDANTVVPEPATLAILLTGMLSTSFRRRLVVS
jgi:hypothetical protein